MEREPEALMQKCGNGHHCHSEMCLAGIEQKKIIAIAQIARDAKLVLHESIQFVEVDVGEELTGHVAQRQSDTRDFAKTVENATEEPERIDIGYFSANQCHQDIVIDRIEKSSDVAFKRPDVPISVCAHTMSKCPQLPKCSMRSLPHPTRIRVKNECAVEDGIEHSEECMMHQSIANSRLVDTARLGVVDGEWHIRIVPIYFAC
jgi:hypothetical protein